jgi:hypothetical protein
MIFGLLSQANLTQNDVLQFHPFTSKLVSLEEEKETTACSPVKQQENNYLLMS